MPKFFTVGKLAVAADADFELDSALNKKPTTALDVTDYFHMGEARKIMFHLTSTNAVTFQIAFYQHDAGATASVELASHEIYRTTEDWANNDVNTDYSVGELARGFNLIDAGEINYNINWSGNPGRVTGFIRVFGEKADMFE